MSRLHVGYVLKVYPRLSETFIVNEILELERQGARVTIFSLRPAPDEPFPERLARVRAEVVYLPELSTRDLAQYVVDHRDVFEPLRPVLGSMLWEQLGARSPVSLKFLAKALALHVAARTRGIDHFHAHFGTSSTAVSRLASRLSGTPYSFTAHAKDIYLAAHDYDALRERIEDASFLVTVCDANHEHLERLGTRGTTVHRIYNGLDLEEFRPSPPAPGELFQILGVGRLVPKKGFDTLIRACRVLKDRGLRFHCRIVGDGDERGKLERLIAAEALESEVTLAGPLPNEVVRAEMSASDVVVLPARIAEDGNRDALPTVLLEAMALGRPFVSTPVTGIPEIACDGKTGRLVDPDRPGELASELEHLAEDVALRDRIGQAGPRYAAKLFDIRRNVAELHARFRESAAGSPRPEAAPSRVPSTQPVVA